MSDSDDDLPISELIKKRKRLEAAKSAAAAPKIVKAPTIKSERKSSNTTTPKPSNSSSGNKSADFYGTLKGQLVQGLLVRWWYAMEWPKPEDIGEPPAGYETLDGFPGVFISTRVDSLGQIMDLRNKDKCPSLKNVSSWSSAEIKELCIKAYEKQMEELEDREGSEIRLLRTLKSELRTIKAIDTSAADRQASKYTF